MSVRRLADESVQPATFAFSNDNETWARAKMAEYPAGRQQSAVIPILARAQDQDGWITRATIEYVARLLSMPYIRVLEVATFYTQFQLQPVGSRAHIQVCGTTPCMLRGAEDLIASCQHKIHHDPHHLNGDGTLSWEEVECLGACVNAPMVAIGHDTYEDLTAERFEEIIDAFAAGKGDTIKPGPQVERMFASAFGGRTTLLEKPSRTREKFVPPLPPDAQPAAAPAAPAAAPALVATAPVKAQEPTTPGRKRKVSEEAAPALKGPTRSPKVTLAKAEAERTRANVSAKADGQPARAMREDATGAESPAGKVDSGRQAGKPRKVAPTGNTPDAVAVPLFTAPAGQPDDLKLISGVGPILEKTLNSLGITRYTQVASMTPAEIAQVEERLKFRGRVERDDWLKQADALARGGEAEYIRVFGKKPR
ncbi:MAG TPA: NADH-quinone oxidoreductase subunit NuoE [Devosiaceae bacterium]|jgi:NADH-quinone oxidoreductase subunit E